MALLVSCVPAAATPSVVNADPGFDPQTDVVDEFVAGGDWYGVNSADFLPDGRVIVVLLSGLVELVNPGPNNSLPTWSFSADDVRWAGEGGQLDVLIDPDFSTNQYFYTYAVSASRHLMVNRYKVLNSGPATKASRSVVWESSDTTVEDYHLGGSINFGIDGMLYITTGDNNSNSALSQDLDNVFGKVLRIDPVDGSAPADNPFNDGPGPQADEIWAYGFRNAFRSSFDSVTGDFWVGDVGGNVALNAYEEVNLVTRGANFGWPSCEGPVNGPKAGPECPPGTSGPLFSYRHLLDEFTTQNKAVIGGEVYRGNSFPASFQGTYVFADYPTGEFSWLERSGNTATSGAFTAPDIAGATPVWIGVSPLDGDIYWLQFGWDGHGQLRRMRYIGSNQGEPYITAASANHTSGVAPLSVTFTGTAIDPNGDSISYHWDFGDGTSVNTANPTHVYSTTGVFQAQLTVTADGDTAVSAPIEINVGTPPVATITSPANGTTFVAGTNVTVQGSGSAGTTLSWSVVLLHDDHSHPGITGTGSSLTLPIATTGHGWEGNTRYQVTLTATDGNGLTDTDVITLQPTKVTRAVSANVPVQVTIDSIAENLPFSLVSLVGFHHEVSVPATTCVSGHRWTFSSWSDSGSRTHTAVTPNANTPLSATYVDSNTDCNGAPLGGTTTTTPSVAAPGAPTDVRAVVAADGSVRVSWAPPASSGDSAIVGYDILGATAVDRQVGADVRSATGTWTSGPDRAVTVRARNGAGAGPGVTVVPSGVPAIDGSVPLADAAAADFLVAAATGTPGASAALVNLTMARASAPGYITADRCSSLSEAPQSTSSGNHLAGDAVANLAVVPLDADGSFCVYSQVPSQVIVDVQGTFSPDGAQRFTSVPPTRVLDTRDTHPEPLAAGSITRVAGAAPAGAAAALVNLTMTDGAWAGYVTADRCSALVAGPQTKSTGNHVASRAVANMAVVPLDADGSFCVYNQSPVQLVVDTQGYFSTTGQLRFTSQAPTRVADTRRTATPAADTIVRIESGAPAGTTAVLANLTMVGADGAGYVTADRCSTLVAGPQRTSSGNHDATAAVANLAVVPVDADGSFCVYVQRTVDLVVDVQGTFSPTGQLGFTPVAPVRVLNTHPDA
jgi:glucose/arabinose dehydrogenase/PKD repeat protein